MPVLPTAPPEFLKQDTSLIDLTAIGVPLDQQSQWPQLVAYPSRFSDEAFPVWESVLEDESFAKKVQLSGDRQTAWHSTITEFLARCASADINPTPRGAQTGPTAQAKDQARRGRIYVVDYCDKIKLFEKMQVRYAHREYIRNGEMLTIYSWAQMFPHLDPTLDKWLTSLPMPRFMRHNRSRLVATVRPNVRVWVDCINLYRIVIGMQIDIRARIEIPGNPVPSRKDIDDFLDTNVWMPLVRSIRFNNINNRLF